MGSNMDELMVAVGQPGRFQVLIFLLVCLNYCPVTFNHVCNGFYTATPPHQCLLYQNSSDPDAGEHVYRGPEKPWLIQEECEAMVALGNDTNATLQCSQPGQWSYHPLPGENTIVMEWDLVCDNGYLSSLATTIYFLGVMLGGLVHGFLSDRFGRRPVMLTTLLLPIPLGVGIAFVQHYVLFVVLRFIQGFLMQGLQISSFVMAMELMVPKHRPIAGGVVEVFWGVSVLILATLAFLIRNWRYIQLAISLPSLLAVFYICFVPESLRWMVTKGDRDGEVEKLLSRICHFNRLPMPKELYQTVKTHIQSLKQQERKFTLIDLVRTPRLRRRSLILFYLWWTGSVGYYGMLFMTTRLAGNKYLNFFIGAAVEMIPHVTSVPVLMYFGRKKPLVVYCLIATVTCVTAGALPETEEYARIATGFAIAARFAMGGYFSIMFLWASELFPTVVRNIGMGACAFWARVGGVLSAQVNGLGRFLPTSNMPVIVYGVLTCVAAVLTLFLPETNGRKLPDSVDDVECRTHAREDCSNGTIPQTKEQESLCSAETSKL